MPRRLGPDAHRYLQAAAGEPVTRPFHLRWALPKLCGTDLRSWWIVYCGSWVLAGFGMAWWAAVSDLGPAQILLAVGLLLGLPGILGPSVSIPVQVDLPATALTVLAVPAVLSDEPLAVLCGLLLVLIGANVRETVPIVTALLAWSWLPLVGLVVPVIVWAVRRPATSSGIPEWDRITAHPIATSLEYHAGRWRDARLMVLPWGVCLVGLYGADWQLALIIGIAYLQLLVATDTVRLYQHTAGPALALAAAAIIPTPWVPLALAGHLFWIWKPERI
jgi:hypothetical protein